MINLTVKTKYMMGARSMKRNMVMDEPTWTKIHVEYMKLMSDLEDIMKRAVRLRDELDQYDSPEPITDMKDIAQGIVRNLINASSGDPQGGMWWILQHPHDFDTE